MTAEQLEAARAERMRQNGHGAITIEDVRTWIEETGLCIFLPRSAQAGQSVQSVLSGPTATPTFVEAVAGQRTNEPTLELISAAETLLVRLEADGVAVRLNLAGQPGDQPDYVVAGWVLPYIYALRGDRDWRRSPQLTGSRQVSQLAVQAAKQLDSANMTATQIRDALGREVTEAAVLRALHELWKQLRIIPVVPEVGSPALWQPLRQRFQKAIAEGASTSQVTAISVLASIYLQAVIAASMEDVEMFLSPLTSRSKIREVVRGLAATRQVHTTTMGHSPMFYVAGTLPEFPAVPSYQINSSLSSFRGSAYLASYLGHGHDHDEEVHAVGHEQVAVPVEENLQPAIAASVAPAPRNPEPFVPSVQHQSGHGNGNGSSNGNSNGSTKGHAEPVSESKSQPTPVPHHGEKAKSTGKLSGSGKSLPPRPRAARTAGAAHPRERSRTGLGLSDSRSGASGDRRRAPMPRSSAAGGAAPSRPARGGSFSNGNGNHAGKSSHVAGDGVKSNGAHRANGTNGTNGAKRANSSWTARPAVDGPGKVQKGSKTAHSASGAAKRTGNGSGSGNGLGSRTSGKAGSGGSTRSVSGFKPGSNGSSRNSSSGTTARSGSRPASGQRSASESNGRKPATSAAKRYSFSGQAKQAPKATSVRAAGVTSKGAASSSAKSHSKSARPAESKRRG